jgi:hypothetical protein
VGNRIPHCGLGNALASGFAAFFGAAPIVLLTSFLLFLTINVH